MLHADHRPYGSPLYELYDQKIGCIAILGHLIFLLGFKNTNNAVFVRIAHPTWYLFFNIHWMLVNYTFIRWGHMQGCLCISDEWLRFPLAMDGIPSDTALFEKLRAWREWSGQSIHRTVWTTPEIINNIYIFTNSYWRWFKNIYYIYVLHLKNVAAGLWEWEGVGFMFTHSYHRKIPANWGSWNLWCDLKRHRNYERKSKNYTMDSTLNVYLRFISYLMKTIHEH